MSQRSTIVSPHAPDFAELRSWLETMLKALRFVEVVTAVIALVTRMQGINAQLVAQVAGLRRKRPRSETLERLERQLLLPFFKVVKASSAPPENDAVDAGKRKKASRRGKHPGRAALPGHLERVRVVNALTPEQRICPLCGSDMKTVGHSICELLDVIPAKVVVLQRLDERVACPYDDTIVSVQTPPEIVERGKLATTLIVEATCDKYIEHSPIERQCLRFQRSGVDVASQTLGRSVAAHIDLLMPVAAAVHAQTRTPGLLATDATGLPVLDTDVPDGIRNGTIWCWTNARWVSFFYSPIGDGDSVKRFLGDDLARTVQCDGTSVTNCIERSGGKRPGCWSHARRGFADAASPTRLAAATPSASKLCVRFDRCSKSSESRSSKATPPTNERLGAISTPSPCSKSCATGSIRSRPSSRRKPRSAERSAIFTDNGRVSSSFSTMATSS